MRGVGSLVVALLVSAGLGRAEGQVVLKAAAGPTLIDTGYNVSAAVGFLPASRLTLLAGFERTHLSSRSEYVQTPSGPRISSGFRGGTMTGASGALRVSLFPAGRPTPYVIAGGGIGQSRPTVNEIYRDPRTNDVRFLMAGAGLDIPVGERVSVFGDARILFGSEGNEGLLGVVPVRAGLSWRF